MRDDDRLIRFTENGSAKLVSEWTLDAIETEIADASRIPRSDVVVHATWETRAGMGVRLHIFGVEVTA